MPIINETCACGAELALTSSEWSTVHIAQERFHKAHANCRAAMSSRAPQGEGQTRTDGPHSVGFLETTQTVSVGRTFCDHGRYAHLCGDCKRQPGAET